MDLYAVFALLTPKSILVITALSPPFSQSTSTYSLNEGEQ